MRRFECMQALAPMLTDHLVVTNVARTGFETKMAMPREGNLYTMGMGLVTPVVLGLALSLPHRGVIALDGDGSILLNLGALVHRRQLCAAQSHLDHLRQRILRLDRRTADRDRRQDEARRDRQRCRHQQRRRGLRPSRTSPPQPPRRWPGAAVPG